MVEKGLRVIIATGLIMTMAFLFCACSSSADKDEAAMNTIQKYQLSEDQEEIMDCW